MCMGSVFGLSAYLGICFAAIVIAYMVLCATRKKYAELAAGLTVLCLGMSFAAPFFLGAIGSGGKGEFPLAFGLRQFEILYLLNSGFARLPEYLQGIVQFCVLPLNYFWGLGFYSLGAMAYWHNRSKSGEQVDARDTLAFIIVLVGFLLGTFVRSRTFNNDFGWRSFMPVVVFCLLWSARYAQEKLRGGIRIDRFVCLQLLTVLIGICTTTYAFVLDRTSLVTSLSGERIYCLRSVYEQLNKTLPNVVMVQQNPTPLMNSSLMAELFFTLFSIHRAPCCTFLDGPWNGPNVPDKAEYELVGRRTKSLFSNISPSLAAQICKTLNIEVLVLQENDPIWNDKSAWIWTYPVLVGTDHVKAFRVGSSVR